MDETPLGRALAQAEKLADETLGPLPPQEPLSFNVPSAKPHLTKVVPATTALGKQLYVDSTGKIVEKPKGISDKAIPDVKLYEKDTPRDRLAEAVRFANEHKDWTFREAKAAVNAVYLAGGGKRRGTRPQEDRPSAGQLAHAYFSDKLVGHPLQAVFDTFMAADNLLGWAPRAFLLQWSEKSAARKQLAKEGAKAIDAKATRAWNERTEKNLKALTTWMFESDTDAPMPELWEWSPADAAKITGAPATAAGNKLFAGVANLADLSTLVFGVGFAMGIREHGLNALAKIRKLQAWVAGRGRRVGANEAEARALADEVRRLAEGTPDAVSRLQERLSRALDEEAALGAPKMPTSPEDHFANTRGLPAGPEPDVPLGPGEYSTGHPPTVIDPNAPALPSAIVTPPPPEELARLRALAERGDAQAEALLREWETDQTGRLGLANKSGVQGFETVDVARRAVGRRGSVPAGVTPEARLGVNWEDARSPASAGTETEAFLPDLEARAAGPGTRVVAEPNTPPLDLEAQAALDQRDLERLHGITKKADDLQNDIDEGRPASGEYARPDLAEWVESYRKAQGYRLTDRASIIEIPQTRLGTQVGYLLSRAFPNSIFNRIGNDWSPVGGKTPTWKDVREALKDRRPAAIRDIRESVENLSKLETRVIGDVNAPPLDQVDLGRMPGDVPPVTAGPGAIQSPAAAPPVQPEAAIDTLASLRRQYPNLKAYNAANSTDFTRWKDALEHARSKASELLTGEGGSYTPGWWKPKNPGTTADARAFWDAQEDAIRASRKPPPGSQTKGEKLRYEILDRQGNVKRALRTTEEGRVAVRLGELAAGAPVRAQMMADEAAKQIYGGLGPQGRREFDAYVTAMRNLEITNADYKGPEFALAAGQGRDEARAWVKHVDATGKLGDFEIRRRLLHSQFDNELKRMSDAGLIDDVQVADLRAKGKHYLPRVLLDKIDPAITVPGRPAGTRASLIPALTDKGSAGMVQQDTEFLMRQYLGRMEARIARNKATAPLYDLAVGDPLNGLVQLIKPGKQPPHGWETFGVYVAGKEHTLAMPAKYAREWIGGPPQLNEVQSVWARALSGSSTLKWFATGANPAFALRNIARDMVHIWLSNDQYATFGPLALAQMTGDMAHVALNFRKLSKDYLMEGGGMELLAHQGRATSALQGPLRKLSDALGAPGVASEMLTRLAHRERSMKNLMAEGMNPKEAREVATYMARTRMDFHQGGQAIKAADIVIPYLNAAIQATRGIGREAVVHPAQFVAKVGQLAAVAGYLQYQNNRANPKIMDEIPMRERESYWVILPESVGLPDLKYTDKQGVERHLYFKIAKDQTVRGFASLAEFMVNKEMGRESKHDVEAIVKGIGDAIPVSLDRIPPTAAALLGVMLNKDFYYNEDLWGKDELSDKTLERRPSTAPVYQAWGDTELAKKLGPFGSPIRAQYAVRQIAPSTSYTDLAGAGVRALLPEVPEQFQKDLTTKLLRNPEIRSILGSTRAEAAAIEDVRDMRIRENSRREDLRQKLAPAADEAAEAFGTPDFNRARAQYEAQAKTLVTPGELEWAEGYLSSRVKLKPIPPAEREWYYETSQAPPEVRAILIWQKWNGIASQRYLADQHNDTETVAKLDAELQQLGKNVAAMGGTRSVRFRNQLQALQRKTAAAHFGLTREDVKALSETRYAPRP